MAEANDAASRMSGSGMDTLTEEIFREADALIVGLLRNALVGIYIVQDGRFRYVNSQLAELFGYSQQELCGGMGPLDLTAPEFRQLAEREIQRRVNNEAQSSRYAFDGLRKDGSRIKVELFGSRVDFEGRPAIIGMLIGAGYSLGAALSRLGHRGKGACGRDLVRVTGRIRQGLTEIEALREWAGGVHVARGAAVGGGA